MGAKSGQTGVEVEELEELDDELELAVELAAATHEELLTVVFLKVIAAVWAITLPARVAPPAVKSTDDPAKTVPANCVAPSNVA